MGGVSSPPEKIPLLLYWLETPYLSCTYDGNRKQYKVEIRGRQKGLFTQPRNLCTTRASARTISAYEMTTYEMRKFEFAFRGIP